MIFYTVIIGHIFVFTYNELLRRDNIAMYVYASFQIRSIFELGCSKEFHR